jgi:SPP1 gp7 family putative phage head morphogenesis protein
MLSRTAEIRQKQAAAKPPVDNWAETLRQKAQLAADARPRRRRKPLRPVHANLGIEVEYRRMIDGLIVAMQKSVVYWLVASFKANEPEVSQLAKDAGMLVLSGDEAGAAILPGLCVDAAPATYEILRGVILSIPERRASEVVLPAAMASDALPAKMLKRTLRKLAQRWQKNFNKAAPELAKWFAKRIDKRSSSTLQKILKRGGWTVEFKTSPAQRDILQATIQQNVSLIKSIPSQYFTQIEGMVMRSVQAGRDLKTLSQDLQRNFGVTRKRAALIARDQSNKANASLTRARYMELKIKRAIWVHSMAGKEPRPTHVRNNGKEYDVVRGWYDPAEKKYIHPGELINCRCVSRAIIPGLE